MFNSKKPEELWNVLHYFVTIENHLSQLDENKNMFQFSFKNLPLFDLTSMNSEESSLKISQIWHYAIRE